MMEPINRQRGIRYANTGTGNSELDSIPSALRYSGRGNACRQLDLQPWAGACLACGLAVDLLLCNLWLKPWIGRVRPFAVNPDVKLLIAPPTDASFPSGHTASSFAAVFALLTARSPLWKPSLALAIGIAFSRLYLYAHWPTDILGGILVGALAGWLGAKLVQRVTEKRV